MHHAFILMCVRLTSTSTGNKALLSNIPMQLLIIVSTTVAPDLFAFRTSAYLCIWLRVCVLVAGLGMNVAELKKNMVLTGEVPSICRQALFLMACPGLLSSALSQPDESMAKRSGVLTLLT